MQQTRAGGTTTYLQPLQSTHPEIVAVFDATNALSGAVLCGVAEADLKKEYRKAILQKPLTAMYPGVPNSKPGAERTAVD